MITTNTNYFCDFCGVFIKRFDGVREYNDSFSPMLCDDCAKELRAMVLKSKADKLLERKLEEEMAYLRPKTKSHPEIKSKRDYIDYLIEKDEKELDRIGRDGNIKD